MPSKRQRRTRQRREVPDLIRQYFREEIKHTFFHDNAEISAAWAQIGAEIVENWILTRPGTRPKIWWRLSAPEPGRTSDGGPREEFLDIQIAAPPAAEQMAFLRDHDLLLPGETKRLAEADFEPETVEAEAEAELEESDPPDAAA